MWLYFFAGAAVMAVILILGALIWLATFRKQELIKHNSYQAEYEKAILELMNERTILARQRNDDVVETNRILSSIVEAIRWARKER